MSSDKILSSRDTVLRLKEMNGMQLHNTDLNFLNHHKGLRPGKVHLLIASAGSGKSALMRKVVKDTSKTSRCLVWLTEEGRAEFSESLMLQDLDNRANIRIVEEGSFKTKNKEELFLEFKKACALSFDGQGAEVIFYDNITTSAMVPDQITPASNFQIDLVNFINDTLTSDKPMSLWVVAHTKKEIPQKNYAKLLSIEDIRGSQTICNRVQFAYTLQMFSDEGGYNFVFIKTHKQRGYDMDSKYYSLVYNPAIKTYQRDTVVTFKYVKDIFTKREKI